MRFVQICTAPPPLTKTFRRAQNRFCSVFSPQSLDVDGVVVFRHEHTLVAGDFVDRRHFLLQRLALDQVDVLVVTGVLRPPRTISISVPVFSSRRNCRARPRCWKFGPNFDVEAASSVSTGLALSLGLRLDEDSVSVPISVLRI